MTVTISTWTHLKGVKRMNWGAQNISKNSPKYTISEHFDGPDHKLADDNIRY